MNAANELSQVVGKKQACAALDIPRASYYRFFNESLSIDVNLPQKRPRPPLALNNEERQVVLDLLHSERFCDMAPHQAYATLLDEGRYLCSIRTMYRLLSDSHGNVKERRRHVKRPAYKKPELLASAPNEVWSWDITKLKGPAKWNYFHLYVIMDIFSRYVVGWMVAHREQAVLAEKLIQETCDKQEIPSEQLTLHADRGSSMKSKCVAHLLADLGVTKTHSRPHVSNDNPYSEAQFKTLKYCPQFPQRFGSIQDARAFCQDFFNWYNKIHHHTGIALMTPEQVHYGLSNQIYRQREAILLGAFKKNQNRFKNKIPVPQSVPKAAWINPPSTQEVEV
jgi:putative transposase